MTAATAVARPCGVQGLRRMAGLRVVVVESDCRPGWACLRASNLDADARRRHRPCSGAGFPPAPELACSCGINAVARPMTETCPRRHRRLIPRLPLSHSRITSLSRALSAALLCLAVAGPAAAEPVAGATAGSDLVLTRTGALYRAHISGIDDFHGVVELLRAQLRERGWTEQYQTDVDLMLRTPDLPMRNKLITLFAPERFTAAIAKRPAVTLLTAPRVLVYQEQVKRPPAERKAEREAPGDIFILFFDPSLGAKDLELDDDALPEALRRDLVDAVATTEQFFRGPQSLSIVVPPPATSGR